MDILRSIDIEDVMREALDDYFVIYCRPLPAKLLTPCIEVQRVGGSEANTIDTFDVVIDSRAKDPADADAQLRNVIGVLKEIAKDQTTAIRFVDVNSSGAWGSDPVRPDLSMCSARLRITAHQEKSTINRRQEQ